MADEIEQYDRFVRVSHLGGLAIIGVLAGLHILSVFDRLMGHDAQMISSTFARLELAAIEAENKKLRWRINYDARLGK
ncbi:hypothetical protein BT63DRAFT_451426 [Microthyrium microscopicum]|uniref:Uncharacterized protein n=1 Tax=Microthyrium microscopicum TaxID=703497 RepID=A0A6A6UPL3_9PEZI|nr:hypothetical protein BT63DRAFT_451426 [Microthyrium microscopicum]